MKRGIKERMKRDSGDTVAEKNWIIKRKSRGEKLNEKLEGM